jgi:hypothetical protein
LVFNFERKHTCWLSKSETGSKVEENKLLMNIHNFLRLLQKISSSMSVNRCILPTPPYTLCVNLIGWKCAPNQQHHRIGWVQSQPLLHQKKKHIPINECWLWKEMKKWKLILLFNRITNQCRQKLIVNSSLSKHRWLDKCGL